MDKKLFDDLESNLKQAVRIARGRATPKTIYVFVTPSQIKAMRRKLGMSQAVFARDFHLSLDTVKGWEQGKRAPGRRRQQLPAHHSGGSGFCAQDSGGLNSTGTNFLHQSWRR